LIGGNPVIEEFLQGKWLKHPLHPAIVHIPVAMWISSFVFDLLVLTGIVGEAMTRLALYAIGFGLLAALLAIPTGIADWWGIDKDKPAWKLAVFHMALNWIASLAFALSLGLRMATGPANAPGGLPVILSAVGVVFLLISAYLGGRLTYDYGISVARNSKEKWRKLAQEGKARVPAEKD
jgi:uncharacterized membrane protein